MAYKSAYKPLELYRDNQWRELDEPPPLP